MDSGKFVERKNSGWCGTPPVSYSNFNGIWDINDSIINITVGYWGGDVNYKWRLLSVTDGNLRIQKLEEKYNFTNTIDK